MVLLRALAPRSLTVKILRLTALALFIATAFAGAQRLQNKSAAPGRATISAQAYPTPICPNKVCPTNGL
jgi:hypothetical protein